MRAVSNVNVGAVVRVVFGSIGDGGDGDEEVFIDRALGKVGGDGGFDGGNRMDVERVRI